MSKRYTAELGKYAAEPIIDAIFILIIGLLSLGWFKQNLLIAGGDWNILSFPDYNRYYYIWEHGISTGILNSRVLPSIPFSTFLHFSEIMGFSLVTTEKILFYILFVSGGLSMYFLTSTFVDERMKRTASLTSAFFYMLNPFTRTFIWHDFTLFAFLYAFIPLMLAIYIKGIEKKKFKYAFFLCVVSLLATPVYSNPMTVAIILIPFFLYFVYHILQNWKNKTEIKQVSNFVFSLAIIFFLLNIWWILPLVTNFPTEFSATGLESIGSTNLDILELNSKNTSFLNIFRLEGHWAVGETSKDDPYYTWAEDYSSDIYLIIIGFLIPIFTFSSLLTKSNKQNKQHYLLYFGILSLIGLFLIKGSHPPFGEIYRWLFLNFPVFGIFRVQYYKLGIIVLLSYTFLLGNGISKIYLYIKQHSNHKTFALIFLLSIYILLFVVHEYPFFTGEVIPQGGNTLHSFHVKVPEYYGDANYWLKEQDTDFRIYSLPLINLFGRPLKWEYGYGGADPSLYLFSKAAITNNITLKENISGKKFVDILSIMNVKYILLHNDADYEFYSISESPQSIKAKLNSIKNIHLNNSFGKLDFYKVSDEHFIPRIYTASSELVTFNDVLTTVESSIFTPSKQIIIVKSQNQNKTIPNINSSSNPHVSFQKINPTQYKVKIENAHEPFYLTFSESFHSGWKVYINTDPMECNPIATYENVNVTECQPESKFFEIKDLTRIFSEHVPEEKHFIVNGYANAWYIDPQELGMADYFTITIYFKPQSYFYIGLIISGLTFMGCIGYLLWDWQKKKITKLSTEDIL